MNTYRVYANGFKYVPSYQITGTSCEDAINKFKFYTCTYEYPFSCIYCEMIQQGGIKVTDYAYKLNKWRKDHENKPWTGTLPPEKLDEDQLRYWFDCYRSSHLTHEIPLFAIEAMYNAIKG